jgi:hypothetical protein
MCTMGSCRTGHNHAQFSDLAGVINFGADLADAHGGKIWYARVMAGDRMVPVRMEFDTAFGGVKGYLAELRGRGVDLHLMRE